MEIQGFKNDLKRFRICTSKAIYITQKEKLQLNSREIVIGKNVGFFTAERIT